MNSNNIEKLNIEDKKNDVEIKNADNSFTSSDFVSLGATL
jgi:hypothetical protein